MNRLASGAFSWPRQETPEQVGRGRESVQSSSRPMRPQPFGAPVDPKAGQDTVGSKRRLPANTATVTYWPLGPRLALFLPPRPFARSAPCNGLPLLLE